MVEVAGHVLGHLDVLELIPPDRHDGAAVDQDVGRHQDRIRIEPHRRADPLGDLVLVRRGPIQQPLAGDRRQDPGQLGHLGHVALAEQQRPLRVEPEGQVVHRHVPRQITEPIGVLHRRQRMVVGDEIKALAALMGQGQVLFHRPQIVA